MKHSPLYWPIFTFSSFYFYFKQITVSQIFCIYHALFISFARLSARSLISLSLQQSPKVICDKGFVKFLSFLFFIFSSLRILELDIGYVGVLFHFLSENLEVGSGDFDSFRII